MVFKSQKGRSPKETSELRTHHLDEDQGQDGHQDTQHHHAERLEIGFLPVEGLRQDVAEDDEYVHRARLQ